VLTLPCSLRLPLQAQGRAVRTTVMQQCWRGINGSSRGATLSQIAVSAGEGASTRRFAMGCKR